MKTLILAAALSVFITAAASAQSEFEPPRQLGEEAAPATPEAAAPERTPPTYARQEVSQKSVRFRNDDTVVRSGPGDGFSIVGVFPKGLELTVIAKSGDWYNVELSPTRTAWVHASLVKEFDDLSDLEFRPNPRMFSRVGSFILTGQASGYSFDRKSNSLALGGRVGYYLLDFVQVEGGLNWTHVNRPAEVVEELFDLRLEEEDFHMLFYNLNVSVEILPGRQMVPFLTGGVGSAVMQGESEPSFNLGAGTVLYLGRKTAMRWEVRNYRFSLGEGDARRGTSNYEIIIGTSFLL